MEYILTQSFFFCCTESDFLQHSEPSYMETTTTEVDPETNERYLLITWLLKLNIKKRVFNVKKQKVILVH